MYYTVYKTTNLVNGKFYIGSHKTANCDDLYLGSGVALKRAIKKYGKENFQKEVLFTFDNEEEMFLKEKELVVISNTSYNMTLGGRGGFSHIDTSGNNNPMKRNDVKIKVIETKRERGLFHTEERLRHYKANTEKSRLVTLGKKRPEHAKLVSKISRKYWEENKDYMRDCLSSTFIITSPNGQSYTTNRLKEFCKDYNLGYGALWNTSRTNKKVIKGKSKGWICQKI